MARRREFNVFSLSFLDVMSCGFGATILLYLILDHKQEQQIQEQSSALRGEVSFLEREVREGEVDLAQIRTTMDNIEAAIAEARARAEEVREKVQQRRSELTTSDKDTLAETEHINQLKTDLKQLEERNERLRAEAERQQGANVRRITGDGDRQYLTGLKVGGKRILVLFDRSASMLDETLVNVIRLRNMPAAEQSRARKWRQAVATVDWLSAQFPPTSEYQIYTFNTRVEPLVQGTEGKWLKVSDRAGLDAAIGKLRELQPVDGTSLAAAFAAAGRMSPPPDNIILITDGLPTQGEGSPSSGKVSGRDRQKLFNQALNRLPKGIPVNVILEPMEGDPMAASAFWQLAQATRGSFLAPASDWP